LPFWEDSEERLEGSKKKYYTYYISKALFSCPEENSYSNIWLRMIYSLPSFHRLSLSKIKKTTIKSH
jgi:hypothetical protein